MPNVVIGLTELNRQDNDSIENKLFHLLYYEAYDPGKFKQAWEEAESNNNVVNTNFDNGYYTFLQYCSTSLQNNIGRSVAVDGPHQ